MTTPSSGVLNRIFRSVSNMLAGHLVDPVYERIPIPSWDLNEDESMLLANAHIVDVDHGSLLDGSHVVVRNHRIVEIVRSDDLATVRSSYGIRREIDCGGHYLIPGLSDIHCHVSLVSEFGVGIRQFRHLDSQRLRNSEAALIKGCTFIRDCGGAVAPIHFIRTEIDAGRLLGPRIMTATNSMSPRGGMWDLGSVMSTMADAVIRWKNTSLPRQPGRDRPGHDHDPRLRL